MTNHIGPIVKYVWNVDMHGLYNFRGLSQTQQLNNWYYAALSGGWAIGKRIS